MKKIEPYFVEFREDSTINKKDYPSDCIVGDKIC